MKEPNALTEQRLKRAIESATPDVLPQVLLRIQQERDGSAAPAMDNRVEFPPERTRRTTRARLVRWAGSVAAALLLCCAVLGYGYFSAEAIIGFDVNPSVELRVNRAERVLSATPLNDDAQVVLSGMNLKNVDLDVAVNALIGSMVKNGYISEIKNSILISVDSRDDRKGVQLQQRLLGEVNGLLDTYSVSGAVLTQTVTEDERLKTLAQQHGISLGKAALVDLLVSQDETLTFSGVAALPINDINLLIAARHTKLEGVEASGQASSSAYIGEEKAKAIALTHAGVTEASLLYCSVKLDYEDGRLVYQLELRDEAAEYSYVIDALSGDIREYELERKRPAAESTAPTEPATQPPAPTEPATQTAPTGRTEPATPPEPTIQTEPTSSTEPTSRSIGLEEAKAIALDHAGLVASEVRFAKQTLYDKNHVLLYDIIFLSATTKYSYEINAATGEVLACYTNAISGSHEKEWGHSDHGESGYRAGTGGSYIGGAKAQAIAFDHAGVAAASASELECKLDEDDGRMLYEIEFISGGMEYEYEIDATTGEVLWWDSEED